MGVDDTQPLISHLIELRKRLLNSIIAILVIFRRWSISPMISTSWSRPRLSVRCQWARR
nr:Sec-independent protein translocase protein TatC [Klebsiella pneumoniae]